MYGCLAAWSANLLAALWAASSGVEALVHALNKAYGVTERRPYWRVKLTALLLTGALAILVNVALTLVLYGNRLGDAVQTRLGLGAMFGWIWHLGQWPLIVACVLLAFNLPFIWTVPEWKNGILRLGASRCRSFPAITALAKFGDGWIREQQYGKLR